MRASWLIPIAGLAACSGRIGDPAGDPGVAGTAPPPVAPPVTPPMPRVDAGPAPCEPEGLPVQKLLRLSNHEYQNVVADLLGVPIDPALFQRWTPVAEVYGFDTMSETRIDAQALEEQMATAEALARLVMSTPALTAHCPPIAAEETPLCTSKPAYTALDDFSDTQGRECWSYRDSDGVPMIFDNTRSWWRKEPDQTVLLWRDGTHPGSTVDAVRRWTAPRTGALTLRGTFRDADRGGGDGVRVFVLKNDVELFAQDLPNGGAANYELEIPVARGDRIDFVVNRKANPNYDTTAFTAALGFVPTPRKAAWTWAGCAEPLVARLASRGFRRPIRAEERAEYQRLFTSALEGAAMAGFAEPVDQALSAVLEALFLSPNLVFKPELVPNGVDEAERAYAVASRLALFARGSIADDTLWGLARSGGLAEPAQLRAELARLLHADIERFATSFGGQWLAYRDLEANPGPLAEAMRAESRDVFGAVFTEGLRPSRLMRPGFTLVDPPLALHYGLTPTRARRIATEERGGLLSQGGFLTRTANGSEFRRPIHRGLWVLTRLLCRTLPRLDAATLEEIGMSFGSIDQSLPLPEKMAIHRNSQNRCGGCHQHIDPVGLALEKYDPEGLWRETYADGQPIVTNLELFGTVVRDPRELSRVLEGARELEACAATKLLSYALHRGPRDDEQCVAERIARPLDGSTPSFESMAIEAVLKALELTEGSP